MVESNKILTVSYGTFSCTLEGFDDAFDTMKAIAEYFRDLAADDRFFGAEPPTPDAEMIARIAEAKSARRVEALPSDNGLVLRQSADAATVASPAVTAVTEAEATAPAASEPEDIAEPEAPADDAVAAVVAEQVASEDVASAEVDEAPVTENAAVEDVAPMEDVAANDVAVEDVAVEEALAEVADADVAFDAEDADTAADYVALSDFDESEEADEAVAEFEPVAPVEAEVADDSILNKLRRIRAVVSRNREETVVSDYSEDQHAEDFAEDSGVDIAALHEATVTVAEDEFEAVEDDFEASVDDLETHAEEFAEFDAEEDSLADAVAEVEADDIEADEPALATGWARVVKVKRADFEAAVERGEIEEEVDEVETSLSPEDEADLQNELAALEAEIEADTDEDTESAFADDVAEVDFDEEAEDEDEDVAYDDEAAFEDDDFAEDEDAIAEEEAEEVAHDADDAIAAYEEDWEDSLTAEAADLDEDEDEDVFAEAEADDEHDDSLFAEDDFDGEPEGDDSLFAEDDASEVAEDVADEAEDTPAAQQGRAKLAASASPGDMDRILAETNNQLGETEGTRRRSAIAHLRAAVAATKAEKQVGSDFKTSDEDSTDAYRQDLAQVVRPRRPRASGTPLRRTEDKPAPLRLVAEQRVDVENEHREPIRPRRVSVADLIRQETDGEEAAPAAPREKDEGFTAFLEEVGAKDLNEVLEAAAAYLAFVEGREQFSRPQLMSRVRQVSPEEYSREDALRAFGTLLREGKIRKVKGGRFTASDRIGFRPDQRAVG